MSLGDSDMIGGKRCYCKLKCFTVLPDSVSVFKRQIHMDKNGSQTPVASAVASARDFFIHQGRSLSNFNLDPGHTDKKKSIIVGISCWFYALPGILTLLLSVNLRWCAYIEGLFYIVTAFNSFVADYIVFGKKHYFQTIDRWTATISSGFTLIKSFLALRNTIYFYQNIGILSRLCLAIFFWIVALPALAMSRKSTSQTSFVIWHSIWHLISASGMCVLVFTECNDSMYFDAYRNNIAQTIVTYDYNMIVSDSTCFGSFVGNGNHIDL